MGAPESSCSFIQRTHPILFPLQQALNLVWPKRSVETRSTVPLVPAPALVLQMSSLVLWSLSTTVSSARCSSCTPSVRLSSTSRPTLTDRVLEGGYRFVQQTTRVTAVEQQSRLVYVGNLPGEVPDATKRAFLLSPFEGSFWWFHRVLLQGLVSSRCLWRNRRKTSPHLVASPASRSVCGTVASACLPDLQRPWSLPSAMPT